MTDKIVHLRIAATVDAARPLLCADACVCHTFDDDAERCCGAFNRILDVPDDDGDGDPDDDEVVF